MTTVALLLVWTIVSVLLAVVWGVVVPPLRDAHRADHYDHLHYTPVGGRPVSWVEASCVTPCPTPTNTPAGRGKGKVARPPEHILSMGITRMHAITVKAWNAYRDGRELRLLKWSPGGSSPEPFPRAR